MARKVADGGVNKSEEIRKLLKENPRIKASEAIETLHQRGIDVAASLFYFTKGKVRGRKGRRREMQRAVSGVMANGSASAADVLATIRKVKGLASEVGGMKKLAALVQALTEI